MELLDIHTHRLYNNPHEAILNCMPWDLSPHFKGYCSVGFHPWYLSGDKSKNWEEFKKLVSQPQVLAIGESGLDKLTTADWKLQEEAFLKQAEIASQLNKPLIIHCVKSFNEIIRYKKELNPVVAWVIHGFRGKKELAKQLLDHGFYLSFGEKYQEESLKGTPLDRLFIETDESEVDIHVLYQRAAICLRMDVEDLIKKVQSNIRNILSYRDNGFVLPG
ncbi:TatD family deoxyribonuclease [Bacteroides sp. 519]|nr:TatD family deoxyribonuclease [Bacteroides sp. 519]